MHLEERVSEPLTAASARGGNPSTLDLYTDATLCNEQANSCDWRRWCLCWSVRGGSLPYASSDTVMVRECNRNGHQALRLPFP